LHCIGYYIFSYVSYFADGLPEWHSRDIWHRYRGVASKTDIFNKTSMSEEFLYMFYSYSIAILLYM